MAKRTIDRGIFVPAIRTNGSVPKPIFVRKISLFSKIVIVIHNINDEFRQDCSIRSVDLAKQLLYPNW